MHTISKYEMRALRACHGVLGFAKRYCLDVLSVGSAHLQGFWTLKRLTRKKSMHKIPI